MASILQLKKYFKGKENIAIGPRNPSHTALIHSRFAYPALDVHPNLSGFRICEVCRKKKGENTLIASKGSNTSTMRKHLATHHDEFLAFLEDERRAALGNGVGRLEDCEGWAAAQADMATSFEDKVVASVAKWIANSYLPLNVTTSESFRDLVNLLRPGTNEVSTTSVKNRLAKMFLQGKGEIHCRIANQYLALGIDHWTSKNTENYSAVTVHYIDNYMMKSHVLSCAKHEGSSTADSIFAELIQDLATWKLDKEHLVCLVSDTESKMNLFGEMLERSGITQHAYCFAHILQLTAVKAFDKRDIDGLKQLRKLVKFVSKSTTASDKL